MSLFQAPLSEGDRLIVSGVVVRLKVNTRARRVSLRLDRTQREIVATAPSRLRLTEAAAFARERAGWISARLSELPEAMPLKPGQLIEVFGQPVRLETGTGRARWIEPEDGATPRIAAMGEGEGYARAVILVIRKQAVQVLEARTAHYAARLGAPMPKVSVADAKSRWGSCKPGPGGTPGVIRYSWRLALAPFEVADYVAAHECAHLLELNHGPRFWGHVRDLIGDERRYRAWLRSEGARLHAFGRQA